MNTASENKATGSEKTESERSDSPPALARGLAITFGLLQLAWLGWLAWVAWKVLTS